jgi:hypothetical protein
VVIEAMKQGAPGSSQPGAERWRRLLSAARLTSPRVVRGIDVGKHVAAGDEVPYLVEE